ncbi:unnamed protein product [Closterium sp. Yama58-4]|nr:unnamed protein product [Closterium sp. Yama58-4]
MDKVNVSGLKALRGAMVTYIKEHVALKRSGRVGLAHDACDDDGEEPPSASQAVGVADTREEATGGVDDADGEAGKAVPRTGDQEEEEEEEEEEEDEEASTDDRDDNQEEREEREQGQEEDEEEEEGVEGADVERGDVVGNVDGDATEEDNAAAPMQTGVEPTAGNAGVGPGGERSKGADGSRGVGQVGPGGERGSKGADGSGGTSVVDQLKKNGARVIRTHSKGDGIRSAEGGPADQVAAQEAGPTASPLVAEKPPSLATAPTAIDGGAETVKGPSGGVTGTTSIPRKPPAASSAPVAPSAAKDDGPSLAATPAPAGPSAAKDDAANRPGPSAPKANALMEMLRRMETHRPGVQPTPVVGAAPSKPERRSVAPQVGATTSSAPPTAPNIAGRPPVDPKSALLRARLGARTAAAPARARTEAGSSATPTSVTVAAPSLGAATVEAVAEKGVSAALATGGRSVDLAQAAKGQRDADIDAIQDLLEASPR